MGVGGGPTAARGLGRPPVVLELSAQETAELQARVRARTATQRANTIWHETLDRFVAPTRDAAVVEAIDAFIERRKGEGGAPPVT